MALAASERAGAQTFVTDLDARLVVVGPDPGAATNPLKVSSAPTPVGTATLTNVASSATNVTLLAANTARLGAAITNDSTAVLSAKFGATASATSFTVRIPAGGYYELPQPVYTGRVDGLWATANGSARITEMSA